MSGTRDALEKTAFGLVTILLIAGVGAYFLAQPLELTSAALRDRVGHTDVGTRLGVRIGMADTEADDLLLRYGLRHLITTREPPVTQCVGRSLMSGEYLDAWKDESWRNGWICLFLKDGKVAGISWYFGPTDGPEF